MQLFRPNLRIALVTHPDKNPCVRATDAFRRLSEAFDCLGDPSAQKAYLQDVRVGGRGYGGPKRKSGASATDGRRSDDSMSATKKTGEKWWEKRTWEEVRNKARVDAVLVTKRFFPLHRLTGNFKSKRSPSSASYRQDGNRTRRERKLGE